MNKLLYASTVVALFASAFPVRAEEVFPFEPTVGPRAIKRLDIVDGPDPIDTITSLYTRTDTSSSAPPMSTDGVVQSPETAVDLPSGRALLVWTERTPGAFRAALAPIRDEGFLPGTWMGGPSVVDPRPSAAFLQDGTVVVVWVESDGTSSRAFQRRASPPQGIWSEPEPVSLPGERVASVHVTSHGGVAQIVYERRDGPATSIVHATPSGAGYDRTVVATSAYAGIARPQVHSHAGVLWIDWVDAQAPTGAGEVAWKRSTGGTWEPTRYAAYDSPFQRDYHVRPGIRLDAIAP